MIIWFLSLISSKKINRKWFCRFRKETRIYQGKRRHDSSPLTYCHNPLTFHSYYFKRKSAGLKDLWYSLLGFEFYSWKLEWEQTRLHFYVRSSLIAIYILNRRAKKGGGVIIFCFCFLNLSIIIFSSLHLTILPKMIFRLKKP